MNNSCEYFSELTDKLYSISSIEQIIQNSYNLNLPNLIYSGQGITNDLHLGHYILSQIVKLVQTELNAKLFFMYSTDEKLLQGATVDKSIKQRIKKFYSNIYQHVEFHDNIENISPRWYYASIFFAKQIKSRMIPKILGQNYDNLAHYYYTPMQLAPLYYFNKNYNIFIVTGSEQLPYFTFANRILKKKGLNIPNYIICRTVSNILMTDKMSSRQQALAITLNEDHLKEKIQKSKSYGVIPTVETLKNDFCYQLCSILNILKIQSELYETGKILSWEYKKFVYKQLQNILNGINY